MIEFFKAQTFFDENVYGTWAVFTKDIGAFKCDDCVATELYWMRAMPRGKQEVRDLNAFLIQNELGVELDYNIGGSDEVSLVDEVPTSMFFANGCTRPARLVSLAKQSRA